MKGLSYSSLISIPNGSLDFPSILEFRGVNWRDIQETGLVGLHLLNQPLIIETEDEETQEITKVYFSGNKYVSTIMLENGTIVKVTEDCDFLLEDNSKILTKNLKIGTVLKIKGILETSVKSVSHKTEVNPTWVLISDQVYPYVVNGLITTTIKA